MILSVKKMDTLNRYILGGMASFVILLSLAIVALSANSPVVVTVMLDINAPSSPASEQNQIDSIYNLTQPIDIKGLKSTLFPTGEVIPTDRLVITSIANKPTYEVAMGGMKKDEMIGSLPSSDQKSLLANMKQYVEACHICGGNAVEPKGFKPQSFNQSNITYQLLNQMGMIYDAGFKAGVLYLPGHEKDTKPYRIYNLNLYAVPISTYNQSGERIYLSDRFAKEEKKLSGSQWSDILMGKFDESAKNGDPVVVVFDNQITGKDSAYLDAYLKFIDYAFSNNATFVTTSELVNISRGEKPAIVSATTTSTANVVKSGCPECDKLKNATTINATVQNATAQNATLQNKTASAEMAVSIKPNFEG